MTFIGREPPESQMSQPTFPFAAIVGQDAMKHALVLSAVDPGIGGLLLLGERGTAKSTAVRALAQVLPEIDVIEGCPIHCRPGRAAGICARCEAGTEKLPTTKTVTPLVDLPLGCTEDRLLGALDLEAALVRGEARFEAGLVGRAHRGILYVDEINLLEDHLVDALLDVAASGVQIVERESISLQHAADFVLIGSGNPEEGELRPQLVDRFGLSVEVRAEDDVEQRVEITRRRLDFERDALAFSEAFAADTESLRANIVAARDRLDTTRVERPLLEQSARLLGELAIPGHRGEIALVRAARAHAAFDGRDAVVLDDLQHVAPQALAHRMRRDPLDRESPAARVADVAARVFAS